MRVAMYLRRKKSNFFHDAEFWVCEAVDRDNHAHDAGLSDHGN